MTSLLLATAALIAGCGPLAGNKQGTGAGSVGQNFAVSVSRPEGGLIQSLGSDGRPDGKIDCGAPTTHPNAAACGPATYAWSETVSFSAIADAQYKFIGWFADCRGDDPAGCSVNTSTSGADKWIAAAFGPTATYRNVYFLVQVYPRPQGGTVRSDDGKIYCGSIEPAANRCGPVLYDWAGASVLSAVPDSGQIFGRWEGDCSGTSRTCTARASGGVNGDGDKTVSAFFGQGVGVRVAVSGLADTNLRVSTLDRAELGIPADGTYDLGATAAGAPYAIVVTSQPSTQVCSAPNLTGTVPAGGLTIELKCECKGSSADCDASPANGCETNLATNAANCGVCGTACPAVANGTPACTSGICGVASCAAGYTKFGNTCVATSRACPVENGTGAESWDGSAYGSCNVTSCDPGYSKSNNSCVPTTIGCTEAHATGTRTFGANGYGACLLTACEAGYDNCDGTYANGCEVSYNSDVNNCGGCGVVCSFPNATAACNLGSCTMTGCAADYVLNGTECVPRVAVCPVANGSGTKTWTGSDYGSCTATSCDAGFGLFEGGCAPLTAVCTDATGTGIKTLFQGAYGPCIINQCSAGLGDCDHDGSNGCEAVLATDNANCGQCGNACAPVANGNVACSAGQCAITCAPDYTLAGAECKKTTISCPMTNGSGTQTWTGNGYGTCMPSSCNPGYHAQNNLCVSNTDTCRLQNATGTQTWTGSAWGPCVLTTCDANYGNCDGIASNGCEAALQVDASHCGSCTTQCSASNGTPACTNAVCTVASCDYGYLNVDGNCVATTRSCPVDNGTGLQTWNGSGYGPACNVTSCFDGYHVDSNACVANVVTCQVPNGSGTQTWVGTGTAYGPCVFTCNPNYGNCTAASGCETYLDSDVNNCNGCGTVCPGTANGAPVCVSGACGVSCNPGYSLWNGGCYANTRSCTVTYGSGAVTWQGTGTQTWNGAGGYGACNVTACDAGFHVENGACTTDFVACSEMNATGTQEWNGTNYGPCVLNACTVHFGDCDLAWGNGCEVDLQTNVDHCGTCDNKCVVPNGTAACTAGTCGVASCVSGYTLYGGQCYAVSIACTASPGGGVGTQTFDSGTGGYGTCQLTDCTDTAYHLANNACEPNVKSCTTANGSGTMSWNKPSLQWGPCVETSCNSGYHLEATGCASNTRSCTIANGTGSQTWSNNAWGTCTVVTCNTGYHQSGNTCAANVINCTLPNASGTQTWNPTTGQYDACVVSSCTGNYLNCDGVSSNGCEALNPSADACGSCTLTCKVAPKLTCVPKGGGGYKCQ